MRKNRAEEIREVDEVLGKLPEEKTLAGRVVRFAIGALAGAIFVVAVTFAVSVAADFFPSLRAVDARVQPYFWRALFGVAIVVGAACAALGDRAVRAIFLLFRNQESPSLG